MNRYLSRCQALVNLSGLSQSSQTVLRRYSSHISLLALLSSWAIGLTPAQSQPVQRESASEAQPSSPETRPILRLGSQGQSVSELQALLKLLGYYSEAIDGVYRDSTAAAVSAFQQAANLQPDGIVGGETWNRLLPAAAPVSRTAAAPTPAAPAPGAPTPATSAPATPTPVASAPAASAPTASAPTANSTSFPSPTSTPTTPRPSATNFPTPTSSPTSSPAPVLAPTPTATAAPTPAAVSPSTAPGQYTPVTPSPAAGTTQTASTADSEFPILRAGMQGAAVTRLQERLQAIGLFSGPVDGVFGAETEAAVQQAQRTYNLEADGVVGPATWAVLIQR